MFSTLPAMGMLPIVLYWFIKNGENNIKNIFTKQHINNVFKTGLNFTNLCGIFLITPFYYFYFCDNLSGQVIECTMPVLTNQHEIFRFAIFIIFEVGLYLLFIFPKYKKDVLYYIILLSFLIYPYIMIGYFADFCMRGTIPALFILYIYVTSIFYDKELTCKKAITTVIIILLLIGSITPIHEISRSVYYTSQGETKTAPNEVYGNFFACTDNNIFYKYFAKKPKN